MGLKGIDWRVVLFKGLFHLATLICLGVLGWALRRTYLHPDIHFIIWLLVCIAVVAYLFFAVKFLIRQRGFRLFISLIALLQLVPILASILILKLEPESTLLKPLTGSTKIYERRFNDMQDKQKLAATANGLAPFKSQAEIESRYKELHRKKKLVKIESNPKYVVRSLSYSSPYVVPKVKNLLDDLSERFQEKTQSRAKFIVTSVLRTEEDVKRLRRVNGNASTNSCHCNATTIDISYVRFEDDSFRQRNNYELRLALAQALHELREEGRCYVKIERKQYCYHITVR